MRFLSICNAKAGECVYDFMGWEILRRNCRIKSFKIFLNLIGIPVEGINGFLIFNWLGYLSLSLQFLLLQIFLLARKKNARRD